MDESTAKQLRFANGYKEFQGRIDRVAIQLGHLLSYCDMDNEVVAYWASLLRRSLSEMSFDFEEADREWYSAT